MPMLPPLIAIVGPTASGKTALSLALARQFQGEVVNADSRAVYRGMDIGTAKVRDMQGVAHHCLDMVEPDATGFSLAEYQAAAFGAIDGVAARGRVPFLVGGTGLYVKAVVENLMMPEVPPDPALRALLEERSIEELFLELEQLDPKTAAVIQRGNKRRLVRALEVVRATGKSFSEAGAKGAARYDVLLLGLAPSKDVLVERIRERVLEQVRDGLLEEARGLFAKYDPNLPALTSLGYPEMRAVLEGRMTLAAAQELLVTHTTQYARRQMTWFRKMLGVQWVEGVDEAARLVQEFLKK